MPKKVPSSNRRVIITIEQHYISDASNAGFTDVEDYIDGLNELLIKKEAQYLAIKEANQKLEAELKLYKEVNK